MIEYCKVKYESAGFVFTNYDWLYEVIRRLAAKRQLFARDFNKIGKTAIAAIHDGSASLSPEVGELAVNHHIICTYVYNSVLH